MIATGLVQSYNHFLQIVFFENSRLKLEKWTIKLGSLDIK